MTDRPLTVRVGVGWSPLDRESLGTPRFFAAMQELDELGYDSIWLSDTATGPGAAPLPLLAAVAAVTERLKLGTSVLVVPPRQPVLLARELATIDRISNGRLLPAFGLGVDRPEELAVLGIPREERGARLEEAVEIIQALWTGEPITYRGRFATLEGSTLSPRPVRPRLEIWLGGSSPAALSRIGRIADGWLASRISPEAFADGVAAIRGAAAQAGRSIDEDHYGVILFAAETEDDGAALRRVLGRFGGTITVGAEALRSLLDRFRAAGATKFVVQPVARDTAALLRRLKAEVVDPFEAWAP